MKEEPIFIVLCRINELSVNMTSSQMEMFLENIIHVPQVQNTMIPFLWLVQDWSWRHSLGHQAQTLGHQVECIYGDYSLHCYHKNALEFCVFLGTEWFSTENSPYS